MEVHVPKTMSRDIALKKKDAEIFITREQYMYRNQLVWEAQNQAARDCGVHLLDPLGYFCDEERCYGAIKNRPIFYDHDHLSEYGASFMIPMFEKIFQGSDVGGR